MKPQKLKLNVVNISWLNEKVIKVDFQVLEPSDLTFEPGQHISLKVADNIARPYSIYSNFEKEGIISIVVSVGHDGIGADFLKGLNKWDDVEGLGPLGRFRKPLEFKENVLMFAAGTGIVPMITMLHSLKDKNISSNITLFFGVQNEEMMFLEEDTDVLEQHLDNFDCEVVYSKPKVHTGAHEGYVQDYLKITDLDNTQVFACGQKEMVQEVRRIAIEQGLSVDDIYGC